MTPEIFNPEEIAYYKRKINRQIEPIKVMLVHRKEILSPEAWLNFVEVTHQSILQHPDQYLGTDVSSKEVLNHVVDKIFKEFLEQTA